MQSSVTETDSTGVDVSDPSRHAGRHPPSDATMPRYCRHAGPTADELTIQFIRERYYPTASDSPSRTRPPPTIAIRSPSRQRCASSPTSNPETRSGGPVDDGNLSVEVVEQRVGDIDDFEPVAMAGDGAVAHDHTAVER